MHGAAPARLVLLLLWPLGLLFPTPVPLGLGQVWGELRDALAGRASPARRWAGDCARPGSANPASRRAAGRCRACTSCWPMALGLLGAVPGGLCDHARGLAPPGAAGRCGVARAGRRRTLSTALNFGPEHALAWWTPTTWRALALGAACWRWPASAPARALAAGLGLAALTALVVLVAQAPADPYFAASLQGWEQGRFIRFHGLAQWIGWLWPYAALAWLLTRLARREPR